MASIGNVTAAAVAARAETTLALANFNFELNLFTKRVSPPAEYEGVGQHLTKSRLEEAQSGIQHRTARKLGLLFKRILPTTPNLIKAYGTRASEISRSAKARPNGDAFSYGPFVDRIGTDATTLWAAATSGYAAIQCHLLGCMLARMWDAPDATSLWEEIIVRRKMEVAANLEAEGEIDTDLMHAANEQFSRSDLADWDASCRSWLPVADLEKQAQQTKLRLIVNNLDLSVNNKPNTYESVLGAWTMAMEEMEKLLGGIPRSVQSGAVLLGLMAWRLYPDLQCLMAQNPRVELKDPLFSNKGILTIGLEPAPGREARSVHWTLPLARLRYYGLPVTKFSSMRTSDRDRLTVDELLFAWFCAYIKAWDNDHGIRTEVVIRYAGDIALRLHNAVQGGHASGLAPDGSSESTSNPSWLLLLSQIANKWATLLDQPRAPELRTLGRNFGSVAKAPFQNIFSVSTYLDVALNLEDKIRLLREIATSLLAQEAAIDYKYLIISPSGHGRGYPDNFEIATACPEFEIEGRKRGSLQTGRAYRRWVRLLPLTDNPQKSVEKALETRIRQILQSGEKADRLDSNLFPFFQILREPREPTRAGHQTSHQKPDVDVYIHRSRGRQHPPGHRGYHQAQDRPFAILRLSEERLYEYDVVLGNSRGVALLSRRGPEVLRPTIHQAKAGAEDVELNRAKPVDSLPVKKLMALFQPDRIDFNLLARYLRLNYFETNASLLGMTFIDSLYRQLGGATVDVRAAKVDLSKAHWVREAFHRKKIFGSHYLAPSGDTTDITFACIAMMETGGFNFQPYELSAVFALSSADSMYIAAALLRDPAQGDGQRAGIRRVTGNIGRAGMAFMIPPPDPTVRTYGVDDWYLYRHQSFDGVLDDSFGGTSLQLSFTEWKQEVSVGTVGGKDVEAYFLETLISVYDKEQWIAELDVLSTFRSKKLVRTFLSLPTCPCSAVTGASRTAPAVNVAQFPQLISVGNYAEIIKPPSAPGIITAQGNWQARLAAASISIAKGYRVILTPHGRCWSCLLKASVNGESVASIIENRGKVSVMIL